MGTGSEDGRGILGATTTLLLLLLLVVVSGKRSDASASAYSPEVSILEKSLEVLRVMALDL